MEDERFRPWRRREVLRLLVAGTIGLSCFAVGATVSAGGSSERAGIPLTTTTTSDVERAAPNTSTTPPTTTPTTTSSIPADHPEDVVIREVATAYMQKIIDGVPELAWDLLCVDQQRRMDRDTFTAEMIPWIRQRSQPYLTLHIDEVRSGPLDSVVEGAVVTAGGGSIPVAIEVDRESIDGLWRVCHASTPAAGEFMPIELLADP